jgi:hypothetical protein
MHQTRQRQPLLLAGPGSGRLFGLAELAYVHFGRVWAPLGHLPMRLSTRKGKYRHRAEALNGASLTLNGYTTAKPAQRLSENFGVS